MGAPQLDLAPLPPVIPDPAQDLFHRLRACRDLQSPAEQTAQARGIFSAGNTDFIADSQNPPLIGLACEVAVRSLGGQELADVAGGLLPPLARLAMAESADGGHLAWAVLAAQGLPNEGAKAAAVSGLLSTQDACERMTHMAFGFLDHQDPPDIRGEALSLYLTPSICRALARSNSHKAIGEAARAIRHLPAAQRAATAEALLPLQACVAVGASAHVPSIGQTLDAAVFLQGARRDAALEQMLMPRARAALARSSDPRPIACAVMAASLLTPGPRRDEVLEELLTLPAYDVVADRGVADGIVGMAFAATLLPPGPRRDAVLERLLSASACAEVEESGKAILIAGAAYAATFLPQGEARDSALAHLLTEEACESIRGFRDVPSSAKASYAAAHLENEGERATRLRMLLPQKVIATVVAEGTDEDVRLTAYAASFLPRPVERDAALKALGSRLEKWAPPHWRDITSGPPTTRPAVPQAPGLPSF
jgi:hypothetical protein